MKKYLLLISLFTSFSALSGCAVVSVADAVISTAATATKVVVKGTGAVIGAAIPDGDDD